MLRSALLSFLMALLVVFGNLHASESESEGDEFFQGSPLGQGAGERMRSAQLEQLQTHGITLTDEGLLSIPIRGSADAHIALLDVFYQTADILTYYDTHVNYFSPLSSNMVESLRQRLPRLSSVALHEQIITPDQGEILGELLRNHSQTLTNLDFSTARGVVLTEDGLTGFKISLQALKTLRVLSFAGQRSLVDTPERLSTLSNIFRALITLEEVDLSNMGFSSAAERTDLRFIEALTNLRVLDLSSNGLQGHILQSLKVLPVLQILNLSHNQIERVKLLRLLGFQSTTCLTHLNLSHNRVQDDKPTQLSQLTGLTQLDLSHNQLTGEILGELRSLSHLVKLYLSGNKVGGKLEYLTEFQSQSTLKELNISGNGVGEDGVIYIASCLPNLTFLNLEHNKIEDISCRDLASLINLTYLDLSHNQISDDGFGRITFLTFLASGIGFSESGRCRIEEGFIPNQTVKSAPEVCTGIFYTIKNKGVPNGDVTWTQEKSASGQYLQVTQPPLPEHAPGGKWHQDVLWVFSPTEVGGCYTIKNRGLPNGDLTWTQKKSASGQYLQVTESPLSEHAPGGEWRQDILWVLSPTEVGGCYTIKNRGLPNGDVTWTQEKSASGQYLQIARGAPVYERGGKWRKEVLWSFIPSCYTLSATITNFVYDTEELLSEAPRQIEDATNISCVNDKSQKQKFTFRTEKPLETTASWVFDKSEEANFSDSFEVRVEAGAGVLLKWLVDLCGPVRNNFDWGKQTKFSEQRFEKTFKREVTYAQDVNIAPYTEVKLFALYKKVDLQIPFEADLRFAATADRLKKTGSVVTNQAVGADAVMSFLHYEGYRGHIYRQDHKHVYARLKGTMFVSNAQDLVFKLKETRISH